MVMPHLFSLGFVNWSNFNPIICSWKKNKFGCNCWDMRIPQSTECFISLHEPNINSFHPPRLGFERYICCRNGMVSALAIAWLFLFSHSVAYRRISNRRSWFSWGLGEKYPHSQYKIFVNLLEQYINARNTRSSYIMLT